MVLNRVVKPKNQRVKRALEKREPKIYENDKTTIFVRGAHTSEVVTQLLTELSVLKKPLSTMYKRKRKSTLRPFEEQSEMEALAQKSDSSLFMFGSHSKKRPNNIILGRMFDGHVLDMFEFGIVKFKSMTQFRGEKPTLGSKPCLVFTGEAFDSDTEYKRLKNCFIDVLRGPKVEQLRLQGVEHVFQITSLDGKIHIRSYRIQLKKSGTRVPRVELEEIGPSVDLVLRRTKIASDDLYRRAKKQPDAAKPKKKKNVSRDAFGTQLGRVHMQKMDLSNLQTRKMKGLKRKSWPTDNTSEQTAKPSEQSPKPSTTSDRPPAKKKRRAADMDAETD